MSMRHIMLGLVLVGLAATAHAIAGIAVAAILMTAFFAVLAREEKRIAEASRNYRITTLSMVRAKIENLQDM